MDTHETGEKVTTVFIEPALSRHWVKRLARRVGVPVETARCWIYRHMPDARRQEIAQAMLAECDELEALIKATRARWEKDAYAENSPVARGKAAAARAAADRVGEQVTKG